MIFRNSSIINYLHTSTRIRFHNSFSNEKNNNVHQKRVKKRSQDINFRNLCNKCNKYHVESTEMTAINSKTSLE